MALIRPHKIVGDILMQHFLIVVMWFCIFQHNGELFEWFRFSSSDIIQQIHNFSEECWPTFEVFRNYFMFIACQLILAKFVKGEDFYSHNCEARVYRTVYSPKMSFPFFSRTLELETKDEFRDYLPIRCNGWYCLYYSLTIWAVLGLIGVVDYTDYARNYGRYIAVSMITSNVLAVLCFLIGQHNKQFKEKIGLRRTSTNTPPPPLTPSRRMTRQATSQLIMQQNADPVVRKFEIDSSTGVNVGPDSILSEFYNGLLINERLLRFGGQMKDSVDLKIFSELRVSWFFMFFMATSMMITALKGEDYIRSGSSVLSTSSLNTYEDRGKICLNLDMVVMYIALFLLTNAKAKFEHTLPSACQDVISQSFGWKAIFYNFTFIPFLYTFNLHFLYRDCTRDMSSEAAWDPLKVIPLIPFLLGYYIYDTAFCQRNSYKYSAFFREFSSFPILPWANLGPSPRLKPSSFGGSFIVDGWFAFARKMHHTGEILMAISLGLMCCNYGYIQIDQDCVDAGNIEGAITNVEDECGSRFSLNWALFQYWTLPFFIGMVTIWKKIQGHYMEEMLALEKYGAAWEEYKRQVPSVYFPNFMDFIPYALGFKAKPNIK